MSAPVRSLSRWAAVATAVLLGMAATIYALASGRAETAIETGSLDAYARLATAPPVEAQLARSPQLRATARLAHIRAGSLREVLAAHGSLASILVGLDADGRTCVTDASPDLAGTFVCDPFRIAPIYLVAEAGGGRGRPVRAGFSGAADTVVRRLGVELADGSKRTIAINPAGGFAYRVTDRRAYPARLVAYGPEDRILLAVRLPAAAPPPPS